MGYLTLREAESVFWEGVVISLGIDPLSPEANSKVRISWPALGQPGWDQNEDIIFIRVVEVDDPYNRQRDITFEKTDSDHAMKIITQTRVWKVDIIAYGPNGYDNQVKIRNRLFSDETKSFFRKSSLFFIPDIESPRRFPELFNGNWWERSDMAVRFNEKMTYDPEFVPYFESVEISIDSQSSSGTNENQDSAGSTPDNKVENTEMKSQIPESEKPDKQIARGEKFGIKIIKS